MTDTDRQRLAAILGMLGSDHAGERAAAGLQAEAFRKKHGLTWAELLALQPEDETPVPSGDPDDPYPDMCDGEAWKPSAHPDPEPAPFIYAQSALPTHRAISGVVRTVFWLSFLLACGIALSLVH